MEDLRRVMRNYRQLDDAIRELNNQVTPLRRERKIVEIELGDILRTPQFQAYNVLKVEDDGSTIKVYRPNTWWKPWSLSKRELETYLRDYFEKAGSNANREDCFNFIVDQQKHASVADDFKMTRRVPNEPAADDE
jgi:phage pi2 protein 07